MKAIVATLFAGTVLAPSADMPSPGVNECAIVSTEILRADPTMIDPTPVAESLRLVVYCGHGVATESGSIRTERDLKIIDVDVEQAQVLAAVAGELVAGDDVFLGD